MPFINPDTGYLSIYLSIDLSIDLSIQLSIDLQRFAKPLGLIKRHCCSPALECRDVHKQQAICNICNVGDGRNFHSTTNTNQIIRNNTIHITDTNHHNHMSVKMADASGG